MEARNLRTALAHGLYAGNLHTDGLRGPKQTPAPQAHLSRCLILIRDPQEMPPTLPRAGILGEEM